MAAKKRKPKPFRATTAVKSLAREVVGTPPATRAEPAKRKKEKHKRTLRELLGGEE